MLKDVCAINMGQSPDSNSYNDNGDGVPFFQGNADFGERYPITRKWCTAPTKMAAPNDILISVRAPIGAMNYAKESCCIGRGLAALTPDKSKVSSEFIFWLMKCKNQELNSKGTGSTFKAIGRKVLEETLVPNITLEKQTEYSAILERVYAVIQARKTELQKLDELVKARFVELFGDPEDTVTKWDRTNFASVCLDMHQGINTVADKIEYVNSGFPIIQSKNITSGFLDLEDVRYVKESDYENYRNKYNPKPSDLLVCNIGTIGKSLIVEDEVDFLIAWNLFLIKLNKELVNPIFIKVFIELLNQQNYFEKYMTGGTVKFVNKKTMGNISTPIPPLALQEKFATFVKQTDKSKVAVQKALDEAQLLFDCLMQKYFG